MPHCAVKWCDKNSKTSSYAKDGITFHRFPHIPELRRKWVLATQKDKYWAPTKYSVICSRHFTLDCFEKKNRRRLFRSALPTLLLPGLYSTLDAASIQQNSTSETPHNDLSTTLNIPTEEFTIKVEDEESEWGQSSDVGQISGSEDVESEVASTNQSVPMKRARKGDKYEDGIPLKQTIRDISAQLHTLTQNIDCFDSFGKYVASMMRSMPMQQAMELQPKIVSLLVEGMMKK